MPLTEGEHHMGPVMENMAINNCAIYVRKSILDNRDSGYNRK